MEKAFIPTLDHIAFPNYNIEGFSTTVAGRVKLLSVK